MMKNILKLMIPCLAAVAVLASCNDEMDDKSVIDAKYVVATKPTVSLSSLKAVSFSKLSAEATVSDTLQVSEVGVQFSATQDFSGTVTSVANDKLATAFTAALSNCTELTTYYARSYAVLGDGSMVVSETQTVTTPASPSYDLNGTYTCTQYGMGDDGNFAVDGDPYEVTVAFAEGSTTAVTLTNLFGGGKTVTGTYDAKAGTVTVPTNQVVMVHQKYGDVQMKAQNDDASAYIDQVTFTFTSKGGLLKSSLWSAEAAAGSFGVYYVSMTHND